MPLGWTEILSYAQLCHSSCYSARASKDTKEIIQEAVEHLNTVSNVQLWAAMEDGDAEARLQMALRLYTGCGASKDILEALRLLLSLTAVVDSNAPKIPRKLRAKAYSVQARFHFDQRLEGQAMNIDSLYRAAKCADEAAMLGWVTPDVLSIAQNIERSGFRRPEDNIFPEHSTERFETLSFLWEAWDKRKEQVKREDERQTSKVEKQPGAYVCAKPQCGIEATHKSALQKCGGKCPPGLKPAYCGKECQKQDWKRHKPFCRQDVTAEEIEGTQTAETASDPVTTTGPGVPTRLSLQRIDDGSTGQEYNITLPSESAGPVRVSSSTMTPEFMKEFRDEVQKLMDGGRH